MSISQFYTVCGRNAFGEEITELVEVRAPKRRHWVIATLMRITPWWAWNVWCRLGVTKWRMVTKITTVTESNPVVQTALTLVTQIFLK